MIKTKTLIIFVPQPWVIQASAAQQARAGPTARSNSSLAPPLQPAAAAAPGRRWTPRHSRLEGGGDEKGQDRYGRRSWDGGAEAGNGGGGNDPAQQGIVKPRSVRIVAPELAQDGAASSLRGGSEGLPRRAYPPSPHPTKQHQKFRWWVNVEEVGCAVAALKHTTSMNIPNASATCTLRLLGSARSARRRLHTTPPSSLTRYAATSRVPRCR